MKTPAYAIPAAVLVVLAGAGAWWWLHRMPPPAAVPEASAPATAPAATASMPPPPPAGPVIAHPIEPPAAAASTSASAAAPASVESLLVELFGRKAVLSMFQLDDFARRFVATVDNLGWAHAPARLWPVNPAAGQFTVDTRDGGSRISLDNSLRYTPYVLLLETVDMRQVVAAYRQLYPRLQRAYEDLGYPRHYFNDRMVEVLDLLLATPDVGAAVEVRLPAIKGPIQPQRPWVIYEFEDPALQSLTAGQKILVRMGPVNERRVKVRLADLRRLLTAGSAPR